MPEAATPVTGGDGTIPVEIGWWNNTPGGALAFFPPCPLGTAERATLDATHPPGLAADLATRILMVRSPVTARLRISPRGVRPLRITQVEEPGSVSEAVIRGMMSRLEETAQRRTDVPVVQISLNLTLVTEEACSLSLTPPFLSPGFRDWPGSLVSGNYPPRSWPRTLNAALEWEDRDRDWVLRRGAPIAYLWPLFDDPRKVPVAVEAEATPALRRQFAQVDRVSSYALGVGPMFAEAERRRPPRLLTPKRIREPEW